MEEDMFSATKDYLVLLVDNDYITLHYRDDKFFDDCLDNVKTRLNYEVGSFSNFEGDKSFEVIFRGETTEVCDKFIELQREKSMTIDDSSDVEVTSIQHVTLQQQKAETEKIDKKIDLVMANQRIILQNQEKLFEQMDVITKALKIKPTKTAAQTKNELVTLSFRCCNNQLLSKMKPSEVMKLIEEKQKDVEEINANGKDIRDEIRTKLNLSKNLGNASCCGATVASFLAPVEFYKNALLLKTDGKGYTKVRANDEVKKLFTSEFCNVFYDSLKFLGASIFADDDSRDSWLAEARHGVHGRGDQMAADGRVEWYKTKDHNPIFQDYEEITEDCKKESKKPKSRKRIRSETPENKN